MRAIGLLAALGLAATTNLTLAAPPGAFTEYANAAVFEMQNRVTPDPMDINAPLQCIDANDNGRDEIIGGGPTDSIWRVIEQRPGGAAFSVSAGARRPFPSTSDYGASQGRALLIDAVSSPGAPKLYAQIIDGLEFTGRYDLRTRSLEAVAYLLGAPIGVRDVDGDGVNELIVFQSTSSANRSLVHIYDLDMRRQLASFVLTTGIQQAIALGNFDDDARVEIASSVGIVFELTLDGLHEDGSFAERMDDNWIDFLTAADVDGDGKDEIVAAYYARVAVIDHDQRTVKWSARSSVNESAFLNVMKTIDLLGTATPEVVIGQVGHPAAPGNFVIFDGASGAEQRRIEHPDIGVFGLNACDVDGDGRRELIAGLFRPITGPDRLYVYDADTTLLKWRSVDEVGMVRAAAMTDADGDGQQEIVFAPYDVLGVGDLRLHSYDASTLAHRWTTDTPLLPQLGAGSLNTLAAGDADADGDVDLVIGSSHSAYGRLWIVDGRTRALAQTIQVGGYGSQVSAVAMANLAGDANLEIIAATSTGVLDVRRGDTGATVWQATWGPTAAREIRTADFDADGATDVLLRVAPYIPGQTELFVVNGATRAVRSLEAGCASSVVALDAVGTAAPEAIVGGCDGIVRVLDAASGSALGSHNVCDAPTPINAIAPNNLSTAGAREVLFTCRDRIGWLSLVSGESKLITAVVGDQIGLGNTLFSGRTAFNADFITVGTTQGIARLQPAASLIPYVWPFNPTTTNIYSVGPGLRLTESITFGAFDGLPVTLEVVQQPRHGRLTVSNAQSGEFYYDSNDSYLGIDMMVVQARTARGVSPPTAIPIMIREGGQGTPIPTPPANGGGGGGGGGGGALSAASATLFGLLFLLRALFNRGRGPSERKVLARVSRVAACRTSVST